MNTLLLALALSASTASTPATQPVKKPAKVWTCGSPQALATDYVQTVRVCEFK
jgi:hypothetical protein